jgi:hypothetical protein
MRFQLANVWLTRQVFHRRAPIRQLCRRQCVLIAERFDAVVHLGPLSTMIQQAAALL